MNFQDKTYNAFCRYELYGFEPRAVSCSESDKQSCVNKQQTYGIKANLHHVLNVQSQNKIYVHSTSKKLLNEVHLYANYSLALNLISGTYPCMVKSKVSHAAFKLMRGSVIGVKCTLRRQNYLNFCYKWSFLAPGADIDFKSKHAQGYGLDNLFVFEHAHLDVDAFETVHGCEFSYDIPPRR